MRRLAEELAPRIAPVLLSNLTAHHPYHDSHLFEGADPPHDPLTVHPAFGNSFDWHSSVHSHWTALQVAALGYPELSDVVKRNLTPANIDSETAYLRRRPAYERPYGWAWALILAAASQTSPLTAGASAAALRAMGEVIADGAIRWLAVMPLPVRHGVHSNTAFAMGLMHDACDTLHLSALKDAIERRAREWFGEDRDWPLAWERSGNDFLSPGLAEAGLMRRVLDRPGFAAWWKGFAPDLSPQSPLLSVAHVPNTDDGQIVHLHGLNLSRAAGLASVARVLGNVSLLETAQRLYNASVDRAVDGNYNELHWLPTFAWTAAATIDAADMEIRRC